MPPERSPRKTLNLSPGLLAKARKPRLNAESGTVLMLGADYFLQREAARAFKAHGWRVVTVNVRPEAEYIQKLLEAILFEKPDLLFTVNHLGFDADGIVTGLIEQVALPAVSWFVDSPAYILLDHLAAVSPWIITPVWERCEIETLKNLGFDAPYWLPLATDPELMGIGRQEQKNGLIGFVGDSMEVASRKWRKMLPKGTIAGKIYEEAIAAILLNRSVHPLDGAIPAGWDAVTRLNFASAVVLEATRRYRHKYLKTLNNNSLKVWGDSGWHDIKEFGAIIADRVEYYRELPFVYGSTSINLNFTSFQMPTTVNQRVFDCPAAGGFLLSDNQTDIEVLFEPGETALFSSAEELAEKADYFLQHPVRAEKISRNAYRRILQEHTYHHRVGNIIAEARRRFAPGYKSLLAAS